jgi:hypothetical protein
MIICLLVGSVWPQERKKERQKEDQGCGSGGGERKCALVNNRSKIRSSACCIDVLSLTWLAACQRLKPP